MGAAQSYLTPETAFTAVVLAGAIGVGYTQFGHIAESGAKQDAPSKTASPAPGQTKKNKKKKKAAAGSDVVPGDDASASAKEEKTTNVVPFPDVIPGQFDAPAAGGNTQEVAAATTDKPKKKKGKKAKGTSTPAAVAFSDSEASAKPNKKQKQLQAAAAKVNTAATTPSSASSSKLTRPLQQSTTSIDTDGSWTRVESRKRQAGQATTASAAAESTTDAVTTATGTSSPVTERSTAEEEEEEAVEEPLSLPSGNGNGGGRRRTLAEKLIPKPRKTGVDDMLETSDYPTIARVVRVQPLPDEKPADGFSWGDYEDVKADGEDADGEDDGWGVVTSKRPKKDRPAPQQQSQPQPQSTESLTKRQRQNAQKRDAQKEAKAAAEKERLAVLAKHRRELERVKMAEQQKEAKRSPKVSGGMKASVDENGRLVWE